MLKRILVFAWMLLSLTGTGSADAAVPDEAKLVRAMKAVMFQEPCCGACPRLTNDQARKLLTYLTGGREPAGRSLWQVYGKKIVLQMRAIDPEEARELERLADKLTESEEASR